MSTETDTFRIVRAVYEAFNRDGPSAAEALLHPAVTFSEPPVSRVPYAGFHSGPCSVVVAVFRHEPELWADFKAVPEAFLCTGESVLVLGAFRGTGRETGQPLRAPFVHECFLREGKVARIQSYPATAGATRRPAEPSG